MGTPQQGLLSRKQLADIGEGFQLDGVAGGVVEEHGRLLAGLALETDIGRNQEIDLAFKARGHRLPVGHWQDEAEMAHGHAVAVNGAGAGGGALAGREMGDDLMAVKIEIHPVVRTAPLGAAEQAAIEGAGGGKVVHREGEMEGGEGHGQFRDG